MSTTHYSSRLSGKTLPPMTVNYEDEIRTYPVLVGRNSVAYCAE